MTEYKGKTNKVNEIKLESGIDRVVWTAGSACIGGKVGLNVDTHFVGNGSEIKIEVKDANGKTLDKIDEKISGNKFWTEIEVPEKAEGSLVATVKLPKHSSEMKSNPLIVFPQIKIKNLKWDKQEAHRGDILNITADVENAVDGIDAEVEIWEYDDDLAHDFITKIPIEVKGGKIETNWEFEYQEDTDDIPSDDEVEQGYCKPEYFFRVKILGVSEDSDKLEFKDFLKMELRDENGKILSDQKVKVIFPDGKTKEEKSDSNGVVLIEDSPPGKCEIEISDED